MNYKNFHLFNSFCGLSLYFLFSVLKCTSAESRFIRLVLFYDSFRLLEDNSAVIRGLILDTCVPWTAVNLTLYDKNLHACVFSKRILIDDLYDHYLVEKIKLKKFMQHEVFVKERNPYATYRNMNSLYLYHIPYQFHCGTFVCSLFYEGNPAHQMMLARMNFEIEFTVARCEEHERLVVSSGDLANIPCDFLDDWDHRFYRPQNIPFLIDLLKKNETPPLADEDQQ